MKTRDDTRPPSERVRDGARMVFEMSQAVREALARHRKLGQPIVVWRDGAVHRIEAEDIPIELTTLLPEKE